MDPSPFEAGSPGRAFSSRANIQRSGKEPIRRAVRSRRSRLKTVYDELRLLSRRQRTWNGKHPGAIQRAHAISARRRGLLVHHNRIRQQRHARLGQPAGAETMADCHLLEVAQEFPESATKRFCVS